MLKKILLALTGLLALAILALAAGLMWAHIAIRRECAPLPAAAAFSATDPAVDLPVKLSWINTASQPMPRSAVLDVALDPQPKAPYVMSYPAFALEWADGRLLLIDAGMTRDGATAFGKPIEWLSGGAPIQPHGSVAEQLGPARTRVQAVIFTHLHSDHVGGIQELCAGLGHPLRVPMTEAQAERPNFTTKAGRALLREAACVRRETITGGPLFTVPGFPGIAVVAAGGHTPGGQIVVAHVRTGADTRTYVFAGDIANHIDGIIHDIPKPRLYGLLIVPEAGDRLRELRRFLRHLRDDSGITVLVSHDQLALEQSGIPAWPARDS